MTISSAIVSVSATQSLQFLVLLFPLGLLLRRLDALVLTGSARGLDGENAGVFERIEVIQNRRVIKAAADQAVLFEFVRDLNRLRQMRRLVSRLRLLQPATLAYLLDLQVGLLL
jgi:hypothetical protein